MFFHVSLCASLASPFDMLFFQHGSIPCLIHPDLIKPQPDPNFDWHIRLSKGVFHILADLANVCQCMPILSIQCMDYMCAFGFAGSGAVRTYYLWSDHVFCMHF